MSEAPFVSCFIAYEKPGFVFDEDRPEFRYFVPTLSGNFYLSDCRIVDESGNCHPNYATTIVNTGNFIPALILSVSKEENCEIFRALS